MKIIILFLSKYTVISFSKEWATCRHIFILEEKVPPLKELSMSIQLVNVIIIRVVNIDGLLNRQFEKVEAKLSVATIFD